MFTIHQTGDNYYFEIPDSLLGRELLLTTWLVKVPGGSPKFGGEIMNTKTIIFDKYRDNKIGLSVVTSISQSDTANVISKAVKNSNLNSVGFVYDIKARGPEGRSSVIDVTDLLQKENSLTILSAEVKSKMGLAAMAPDRSYVKSVASYPINMEIKMLRTYTASPATPKPLPGQPASTPLEAAKLGGAVTMEISASILLMPEKPMTPRRFDARVGYFANGFYEFSDYQRSTAKQFFCLQDHLFRRYNCIPI